LLAVLSDNLARVMNPALVFSLSSVLVEDETTLNGSKNLDYLDRTGRDSNTLIVVKDDDYSEIRVLCMALAASLLPQEVCGNGP
jgi:hypothetical protein